MTTICEKDDFEKSLGYTQTQTLDELKELFKNKKITVSQFKTKLISLYSYSENIKDLLEGLKFIASTETPNSENFSMCNISQKQKEKIVTLLNKGENISLKEFIFVLDSLWLGMKIKKIELIV